MRKEQSSEYLEIMMEMEKEGSDPLADGPLRCFSHFCQEPES